MSTEDAATPRRSDAIPTAALIEDLRRLAAELGEPPTADHVTEAGRYGTGTYYRRFDSWADALDAAGLEARGQSASEARQQAALRGSLQSRDETCPYCGQPVDGGEA